VWRFDFMAAMAAKKQTGTEVADERATMAVAKMQIDGVIVIKFTKPMIPMTNLAILRNGTFTDDSGKPCPLVSIEMLPSEWADTEKLTFDWMPLSMTEMTLSIQILFDNAEYVSSMEPDKLRIVINDQWTFLSKDF
jgi:hypothetical protein